MNNKIEFSQQPLQRKLTSFQLLQNCQDGEMPKVTKLVEKFANAKRVLILGETGTGKEIVARAIHERSKNANGHITVVDCSNVSGDTLRSELFGHEAGSFTGATSQHIGLFEQANCGTAFLDEIGEVPLEDQAKLLRVIQEGTFRRVGGNQEHHSNFSLITATNRNLPQMIRDGKFRHDLYFRLQTFKINIPSLRERKADILRMANYFVDKFSESSPKMLSPKAEKALLDYTWPGNVRELESAIERAVVFSENEETISEEHLETTMMLNALESANPDAMLGLQENAERLIREMQRLLPKIPVLDAFEKMAIKAALLMSNGNRLEASEILGIDAATIYRKLKLMKPESENKNVTPE